MLQAILVAALQYGLPAILAFVAAHQKANNGAMPTPAQVIASTPELQILGQGAAWLDANPTTTPAV
jgi:hypothetical protein